MNRVSFLFRLNTTEKANTPTDNVEQESYEYRNRNKWQNVFDDASKCSGGKLACERCKVNHNIPLIFLMN